MDLLDITAAWTIILSVVAEESNNLQTVDFGASDAPLINEERQAAPGVV